MGPDTLKYWVDVTERKLKVYYPPIMESQMDKKIKDEMEIG